MEHVVMDLSRVKSDRSLHSEARLMRRVEKKLDDAVSTLFQSRNATDLADPGVVTIKIKLDEPTFRFDRETGHPIFVIPGNPQYYVGDLIEKPQDEDGNGTGAGAGFGTAEDEFVFELPGDVLERRLFEELGLPDMQERQIVRISEEAMQRAGFRSEGPPATLDINRSAVRAAGRRFAFRRASTRKVDEAEAELEALLEDSDSEANALAIEELQQSIAKMKARRRVTPYFDNADLRYRNSERVEIPISQAVVFCLMDVSASMSEHHKGLAKRFFWLLQRLIRLEYKEVEVVFIKHTHEAKEVDEHDFFYSRETGGTIVSTVLQKMLEIGRDRYPLHLWNYYVCQASDGDTMGGWSGQEDDALTSAVLVLEHILPIVQYYAYIECWAYDPGESKKKRGDVFVTSLWKAYDEISGPSNFKMERVWENRQIWPVFRSLFREKDGRKRKVAA